MCIRDSAQRPRILTLSAEDLGLASPAAILPKIEPAAARPSGDAIGSQGLREAVAQFERTMVEQALERHGFSWAAAARALQVDPANLARTAKRLGVARR